MPKDAAGKISVEDLNRKIGDLSIPEEELAKYFELDPARSGPMDPALKLNPDQVQTAPTADGEAEARSAAMLNSLNWISRLRRQARYQQMVGSGAYKGPLIVSEGDSWFQYPIILKDVIDHLLDDYAIFSLDAAGDTLDNMVARPEYLDALEDTGASILLLSGGGNDLVAGGNLASHLRDFDPALSPEAHLLASFGNVLDAAVANIERIVRGAGRAFPKVHVIGHGYDYTIPAKGSWLGEPMKKRGITDPAFQKAIAHVMVDRFNAKLIRLAAQTARLTYVDCRNTVGDGRWHDELHPVDAGYADVAKRFKAAIKAIAPQERSVSHTTRSGPASRSTLVADAPPPPPRRRARAATRHDASAGLAHGRALHVGLNAVDPAQYEGWDGALTACEFDAEDMADIAKRVGFQTQILLTKAATLKAVTSAIEKAAKASKPGDIFLFSYSGHGGQITDFNHDEDDEVDETLCLYDGQLIDDEIYALWSNFAPDTRILVITDCCHSGTNVRARIVEDAAAANAGPAGTPRAMPRSIAARVVRRHREFYEARSAKAAAKWKGAATREMAMPVAASVRLISACQDNQVAMDGLENGLFTSRLRQAWGEGAFHGNYKKFHRAILDQMPSDQTPNFFFVGQPSPAFDTQRPFDI